MGRYFIFSEKLIFRGKWHLNARIMLNSSADMCLNCSLSVKSTKIGMMTVFKALKKIGYGAIAKTTVKGHLKGSLKTAAILNRK